MRGGPPGWCVSAGGHVLLPGEHGKTSAEVVRREHRDHPPSVARRDHLDVVERDPGRCFRLENEPVRADDFFAAFTNTKPSITKADAQRHLAWAAKFGAGN